jgi:hypothetical protein
MIVNEVKLGTQTGGSMNRRDFITSTAVVCGGAVPWQNPSGEPDDAMLKTTEQHE